MFRIRNRVITTPIIDILNCIRYENAGLMLNEIKDKKDNIMFTCPWHAGGKERHPSASIYVGDGGKAEFGVVHCFTCGKVASLIELVAYTMNLEPSQAEDWLIDNFSDVLIESPIDIPDLIDEKPTSENLDISILQKYRYYHPYMQTRKLCKEAVDYLGVGFDPQDNCLTFPVFDVNNNLKMITKRSVNSKHFYIPENVQKPVYLLNFVLRNNFPYCVICESQINALYCWSLNIPAVALIGTGSGPQYQILNKSGITHWVLMFDGDNAGRKGASRFKEHINQDTWITDIIMPAGKDVNDLTALEVNNLLNKEGITWRFNWKDIR